MRRGKTNPTPLRQALRRLTDPRVISWPLFWFSLIIWLISFYPRVFWGTNPFADGLIDDWIISIVGGQIVLFAFLLIARRTIWRSGYMSRHPALAVWTFTIGMTMGVISANIIASNTSRSLNGLSFGFEHVLFGVIGLCIIGSSVIAFKEYRFDVAELAAQQEVLLESLAHGEAKCAEERWETHRTAEIVMSDALTALDAPSPEAVARLHTASEDILRPLSHALATSPESIAPVTVAVPKPRWRNVLTDVTTSPLIAPRLTAFIMLLITWRITFTEIRDEPAQISLDAGGASLGVSVDLASFGQSLFQLASVFLSTLVAAWLVMISTRPLLRNFSPAGRWIVIIVSAIVIAALSQLLITILFNAYGIRIVFDQTVLIRSVFIITIAAISVAIGLIRAVEAARRDVKTQIDDINHTIQWQIARINQEIWEQRRTMASVIHGPLRAALISSAMELAHSSGATTSPGTLTTNLRTRIIQARADLTSPQTKPDLLDSLNKLRELWRGTCDINLTIDPETVDRLAGDLVAAHSVDAILGETCANAITHGSASKINITMSSAERHVHLTVTNNGKPPEPSNRPGLGTAFLDDVSLHWSLTPSDDGGQLTAVIPLSI